VIFVTVGTQLPFPRLLDAINELAPRLDEEIVAQCGPGVQNWPNLECHHGMAPDEYNALTSKAKVIVSHAGIGTILTAKSHHVPLIVMPRRHEFGEHRNDHQLATARYVDTLQGIHVAWTPADLEPLLRHPDLTPATNTPGPTYPALLARLRTFIDGPG